MEVLMPWVTWIVTGGLLLYFLTHFDMIHRPQNNNFSNRGKIQVHLQYLPIFGDIFISSSAPIL